MRRSNLLFILCIIIYLSVTGNVLSGPLDMESLVPKETPDGWFAKEAPQFFTRKTLFEHINGQADLFLQYGFERSIFTTFRNKNSSKEKIDLDIYDMGEVIQAFGIFSRFRQDNHPAGIGFDSHLNDDYIIFYKGKYFIILQATEPNPSDLKQLARIIESRINDDSLPPKEIGYFPKRGLKLGSIEYYPQGLMGRQFLKRGFKGTYLVPDRRDPKQDAGAERPDSNLFIAIFSNAEEAQVALKKFREVLSKSGRAKAETPTQHMLETVKGKDAYQGKLIIVRKGEYLAGAAGFEREQDEESLLAELLKQIK